MEFETICRTVCLGIGRETVLSLGNTDRELFSTQFLDLFNHRLGRIAQCHAACSVKIECNLFYLLLNAIVIIVSKIERG